MYFTVYRVHVPGGKYFFKYVTVYRVHVPGGTRKYFFMYFTVYRVHVPGGKYLFMHCTAYRVHMYLVDSTCMFHTVYTVHLSTVILLVHVLYGL